MQVVRKGVLRAINARRDGPSSRHCSLDDGSAARSASAAAAPETAGRTNRLRAWRSGQPPVYRRQRWRQIGRAERFEQVDLDRVAHGVEPQVVGGQAERLLDLVAERVARPKKV